MFDMSGGRSSPFWAVLWPDGHSRRARSSRHFLSLECSVVPPPQRQLF